MVTDASAVVALLTDAGPDGTWAAECLSGSALRAPSIMPFEVGSVLRRLELAGIISPDGAAQAHADLLDLNVELWAYGPLAPRAWELRHNLSLPDGTYVALAELLQSSLVTLDHRIARAPGVLCRVLTQHSGSPDAAP